MTGLRDAARGRWQGILSSLGIPSAALTGKHVPCPVCSTTKKWFRFDDKDGRGTWICAGCGAGDGISLVEKVRHVDFRGAAELIEPLIGVAPFRPAKPVRARDDERASIERIWHATRRVDAADPVGLYLAQRLGLTTFPPVLRTAESLAYRRDDGATTYHPAMVAKVSNAAGDGVSLHRTYLTGDGRKIDFGDPRRLYGPLPDGAAIRLAEAAEEMGVAEGIETAIAASILFNVPVWACINANNLQKWRPPAGVKRLVVFGDNDASFTGQAAAHGLAKALAIGRLADVDVKIPAEVGTDWNDVLLEGKVSPP